MSFFSDICLKIDTLAVLAFYFIIAVHPHFCSRRGIYLSTKAKVHVPNGGCYLEVLQSIDSDNSPKYDHYVYVYVMMMILYPL